MTPTSGFHLWPESLNHCLEYDIYKWAIMPTALGSFLQRLAAPYLSDLLSGAA